jgi:hypothetical protein
MRKKKVDPAKQAEKAHKDAARMKQMGEATGRQKRAPRADFSQPAEQKG